MRRSGSAFLSLLLSGLVLGLSGLSGFLGSSASAQTRIMPLGDSITQGGLNHASYRYSLYFDLIAASYVVDFVGRLVDINGGGAPNPLDYPNYLTTFDRDHEGYWGWRTDQILPIVDDAAVAGLPDIVLIQLGTNDIGQQGAAGVANADTNLRLIIPELRAVNPSVVVLLAQIPPLGPGSGYYANAAQVAPLNAAIAQIALDLDTAQSPVVLVDQNSGFDLLTMMQGDGIHPNALGEAQLASVWQASLAPYLTVGNIPPGINLTAPSGDLTRVAPVSLALAADAWDADGSVAEVRFMADGLVLGVVTTPPYAMTWSSVPVGTHSVTAVVEDDIGETSSSDPVIVEVLPFGSDLPIAISNWSFEEPVLSDSSLANGPGTFGGWVFAGTANTYLGIFNPPIGSYASAGGNATPTGADGSNVAFLFNDGGPSESVEAVQLLADTLQAQGVYTLEVAIGRFNPSQPYAASTYGGYRIELLAGSTVIASDSDSFVPPMEAFQDAVASVTASNLPASLIGQPLSIRLTITATEADRSTHFDAVRLGYEPPRLPALSPVGLLALSGVLLLAGAGAGLRARLFASDSRTAKP